MRPAKFSLVLLLALLSIATVSGAPRADVPLICPNGQCTVYMPLTMHTIDPQLLSPSDSTTVGSLAPLLTWVPGVAGVHQIQLSQDSLFSPFSTMALSTTKSVRSSTVFPVETLVSTNLKPNTIYYWRIGVPTADGYVYPFVNSFVTPAAETITLPPIVALKSPGNNSKMRTRNVTLVWYPVADTISYRVRVYYPNGDRYLSDDVPGTATSLDLTSLPPRTTFTWRVRAFGPTGWSADYSQSFVFTTP